MNTRATLPRSPSGDTPPATPTDHTDIDPTSGTSYGNSVEPDHGSGQPGDTVTEKPVREDRDDAMAAIYASRSDELRSQRDDLSEDELEQVELLESFAAGAGPEGSQENARVNAMVAEAQGNPVGGEPGTTQPARTAQPAAPGATAPPEGLSPETRFNLNVYGEERDLTWAEAQQLLQQEVALGTRARAVSEHETTLRNYAKELEAWRDRIIEYAKRNGHGEGQGAPAGSSTDAPPDQGARPTGIKPETVREITRAILSGDEEQATEALVRFAADVSQGRADSGPTPPLDALAREVAPLVVGINREQQTAEVKEQQRQKANAVFRDEFADVMADPKAKKHAQAYMRQMLEDPDNAEKSYEDLARDVGAQMRAFHKTKPAGTPSPTTRTPSNSGPTDLSTRRTVKRSLPVRPASAQSAPLSEPTPAPPDGSEVVRRMRESRGQPV